MALSVHPHFRRDDTVYPNEFRVNVREAALPDLRLQRLPAQRLAVPLRGCVAGGQRARDLHRVLQLAVVDVQACDLDGVQDVLVQLRAVIVVAVCVKNVCRRWC